MLLTASLMVRQYAKLTIHVIGHLWWWEVQYPKQQFATANKIHIPANQPVRFVLSSPNVIHSFWAPGLQGKMDLVLGRVNTMWLVHRPVLNFGIDGSISPNF